MGGGGRPHKRPLFMKKRYEGEAPQASVSVRSAVAQELKSARRERKMTQQELADLSGTQKSNISRLESGKYNPTLDFLVKVAGSLGRQVRVDLIGGENPEQVTVKKV